MFAEQPHPSALREFFNRLRPPVIRGLDAYPLFLNYFRELAEGKDVDDAKRHFRDALEVNLRSYTQEGIGNQDIIEYGIEVTRANLVPKLNETSDRIVFRDYQDNDTLIEQQKNNHETYKDQPQIVAYFNQELKSWEKLWQSIVEPYQELIGNPHANSIIAKLTTAGFRHLEVSNAIPELCEISVAVHSLFPELATNEKVELYEHPQKYILASPRHYLHHNGETSIARLVRFVYIPKLNKFAFLERGLFTAYTNDQIATFFTLDGKEKPSFSSPEAMLAHVTLLAEEFATIAPHAVFSHIINQLGSFPEIPVGKNVDRDKPRTFTTQISYVEQILAFETQLLEQHPLLATSLNLRLEQLLEPIEHSLLRGNELNVEAQVANYIHVYSDLAIAQNPKAARRTFRLGVLASYPDFATQVGSILDCSSGTILGGLQKAGGLGGIETIISAEALGTLHTLEGRSISNRSEFEKYAKRLGKDPAKFTHWGVCQCPECASKGMSNYLGACGWCLACEVKDDLGFHGKLLDITDRTNTKTANHTDRMRENIYLHTASLGDVIAGITSGGKVYESLAA